jgi:hypothetical protein
MKARRAGRLSHDLISTAPGPSIDGNLHALAKLLWDMLEAVTEAEALAVGGDANAAIARLDGLEARLNDARDIGRGTFALHRTR